MHHRAGLLKQSNKGHGTLGHKSKRSVENINRGRVGLKDNVGKKFKTLESRKERRNKSKQVRDTKKTAVLDAKRNLGSFRAPPILVAVLNISPNIDNSVIETLTSCDDTAVVTSSATGAVHLAFPRFKKRFTFINLDRNNLMGVLDGAKVCDSVVCVAGSEGLDAVGERLLSAVLMQGLPAAPTFVLAPDSEDSMDCSGNSVKKRQEAKKSLLKYLERKCSTADKLFTVGSKQESNQEGILLLRHLSEQKRRGVNSLRARRPHLLAEEASFVGDDSVGTVKLSGYVRCANTHANLSVNRLVHVPGWGDFQLSHIEGPSSDPHPLQGKRNKTGGDVDMDNGTSTSVLATADPSIQESLVTENEPDGMDAEQTWPTEEEMMEAEKEAKEKTKRVIKVPKGTSEYQAAWIMDKPDDDEEDDEDDYEDEEDESMDEDDLDAVSQDDSDPEGAEDEEEDEFEELTVTEGGNEDANYDEKHVNAVEEQEELKKIKAAAKMDALFPDEVDTPVDMPAKVRFQKYRGLQSFRTSPWDPKENLPHDYARIFQFENFMRTRKRVFGDLKDEEELGEAQQRHTGVEVGTYAVLHLKDVPRHLFNSWKEDEVRRPLVAFSMLPHEQKMCVLNFAVKRHPGATDDVIKSKERLIFHLGYRRFAACPIFSQHTNGDKHKHLRYWQSDNEVIVMTTFAPIMFPPSNVLVYRELSSGRHQLVGSGSLLSADPDRLVIKRNVLSGHPFKVHRKSAVVRFMFFNRSDIEWFKPVELRSKRGRRGHIKEPLGTHGHMKVTFDGLLSQQDTVLMNLYKRVFPKWTYDPFVSEHKQAVGSKKTSRNGEFVTAADTLQLTKKNNDLGNPKTEENME